MEEDSDESESHPLYPRSARQSCFMCKRKLEEKPGANLTLKLFLGLLQLLHLWSALVLVFRKIAFSKGEYFDALIPLSLLVIELTFICTIVLFLIFNDLFYRRIRGITLWQRQAICRLVRNIFALLLLGFSLLLMYFRRNNDSLNLLKVLFPILLLNLIVFWRFLLINSEFSIFWLASSALLLSQQVLLVLKVDYELDIMWEIVLIPSLSLSYIITAVNLYLIWTNRYDLFEFLLSIVSFTGCVAFSVALSLSILQDTNQNLYITASIGLFLASLAYIEAFGNFLMDIVIGHIDIDILDLKHPIQTLSNTPHSV